VGFPLIETSVRARVVQVLLLSNVEQLQQPMADVLVPLYRRGDLSLRTTRSTPACSIR
jgi:hypothetical protein